MNAQAKRVRPLVTKWAKRLGLWKWDISIEISPDENVDKSVDLMIFADCMPHHEYENADITFYAPSIARLTDWELENIVIHELLHCIMDEAEIRNAKREEHVVTLLSRAFQAICQN